MANIRLPENDHLDPLDLKRLERLYNDCEIEASHFIGYPCSIGYDYSALYPFLKFTLNNVGDAFADNTYKLNTHDIEIEVVKWFSELLHNTNEPWGYVTNGGTEGNMYGAYLARELYPNGIFYYSEASHYSIPKILRLINARSVAIKALPNGQIDCEDLAKAINIYRDVPPIIFANIGTTMTGAIDDIDTIHQVLKDCVIRSYYIHCDAALSGCILPFVDEPQSFDFSSNIDSIAISGHKMIGSPIPCGIVLAKKEYVDRISKVINYIGSVDTTLSGSRNGITPLFMWYAIKTLKVEGLKKRIAECLRVAEYAIQQLNYYGIKAWKNPNSITVVFKTVHNNVLREWQIAVDGDTSHIITMPQVTTDTIDAFIKDLIC